MTQHTSGPWHRNIKPARKYPTVFAGRNTHIAVMQSISLTDEEIEANTNLVMASPDLYAALKRWQTFARNNGWTDADHHDADGTGWITATDAAIAKAETGE